MRNLILLTVFFMFSATTLSSAQSKMTQKERFQATYNQIKDLVKSKDYKFVGEVVYNNKRRRTLDSNSNSIILNQDSVSGQIFALNANSEAVDIKGKISNYNVNFDDDTQKISIVFSLENMSIYIDIKPNGNTFLALKSSVNNITQVGKLQNI